MDNYLNVLMNNTSPILIEVLFFRMGREFWDENKACEARKYVINGSSERRAVKDDFHHRVL